MQSRRRRDLNAFQRAPLYPRVPSPLKALREFVGNFAKLCPFCQAPHATNCATTARRLSDLRSSWRLSCNADQSQCCGGPFKMPQSLGEGTIRLRLKTGGR
jgi:hypothetical protein